MRGLITEEEFDRLPMQSQMHYLYCPYCGCFYIKDCDHLCYAKLTS